MDRLGSVFASCWFIEWLQCMGEWWYFWMGVVRGGQTWGVMRRPEYDERKL